jgi:hypothetical protein
MSPQLSDFSLNSKWSRDEIIPLLERVVVSRERVSNSFHNSHEKVFVFAFVTILSNFKVGATLLRVAWE